MLLEKADFGGATSWNSLQIIHGGLRYLQSLGLRRFRESVNEQDWFLRYFPDLVVPLKCLMPLYNRGLHRTWIFQLALLLNDILTRNRNLRNQPTLEKGSMLRPSEVISLFSEVDRQGLCGGAVWHDAVMVNSQRVIMEILHWASHLGAESLNYVEVEALDVRNRFIQGVLAKDRESGKSIRFQAPVVVNCAGPWSRRLAQKWDRDIPKIFEPSLAFNLIFDRKPISSVAVAIRPKSLHSSYYFLRPYHGRLFAGTYHTSRPDIENVPKVEEDEIDRFISDLNASIPDLNLKKREIFRILSGYLPAREHRPYSPRHSEVLIDHKKFNGPIGFYSVSGVKFTTARSVAEKTLKMIFRSRINAIELNLKGRPTSGFLYNVEELGKKLRNRGVGGRSALKSMIESEAIIHLDDLVYRRSNWFNFPDQIFDHLEELCSLFPWDNSRKIDELNRLDELLRQNHPYKS